MNIFKKSVAIISLLCILVSSVAMSVGASSKVTLPTSAGIEALRAEFESGVAPEAGGYALDYCYYSPAGKSDSEKYPLVIFLHGIGHADYVGAQLADSDMPYWASTELQSRFESGGAYILLPRCPEDTLVFWNTDLIEPIRALIDDFIATHEKC